MFICTTHLQSKIISESSINRGAESVFRQRSQMYVEAGGAPCEPGAGGRHGYGVARRARPAGAAGASLDRQTIHGACRSNLTYHWHWLPRSNPTYPRITKPAQTSPVFCYQTRQATVFQRFFKIQNFWKRHYKNETVKKQRKQMNIAISHRDSWK